MGAAARALGMATTWGPQRGHGVWLLYGGRSKGMGHGNYMGAVVRAWGYGYCMGAIAGAWGMATLWGP